MNRRILFAEFMGWRREDTPQWPYSVQMWRSPNDELWHAEDDLPNPEKNDADCIALVRALNSRGYSVRINCHPDNDGHYDSVFVDKGFCTVGNSGCVDDWKQGVCDLAKQIIKQTD